MTGEYSMLPRATHTRGSREAARGKQSGRTQEIQRLIGASGTSDDQVDRVWSTDDSVANGAPDTFDLAGSLTSKADGTTTITFAEITHIVLQHTSGTGDLSLGAGSNPVSTLWGASGDAVVIGPGGLFVWSSPTNGAAVTAGTGDILTISSSSGTIGYSLMVVGRSA